MILTVNYKTMISTNTQLSSPEKPTIPTIPDAHRISRGKRNFKFTLVFLSETFIPERFVQTITSRFKFWTPEIGSALELRAAVKISGKVIFQLRAKTLCSFFPLPPRARRRARRLHWRSVQDRAAR